MDVFTPKPTIWTANPKLKNLLLVFIIVFLISGIGLAVLAQVQAQYRQKIYEETQAGLPVHKVEESKNQIPLGSEAPCLPLPKEISSNTAFKAWLTKQKIEGEFCKQSETQIKPDIQSALPENAEVQCQQDAKIYSQGVFLPSPDKNKSICMGNFGEPDSDVWLNDKTSQLQKRLLFCGTPCGYQTGFWLDNDRFVLFATYNNDGYSLEYGVTKFDFKTNTSESWMSSWKTYRNEEYGFEFRYPIEFKFSAYINPSSRDLQVRFDRINPDPYESTDSFEIVVWKDSHQDFETYYYGDTLPLGKTKLAGLEANLFASSRGFFCAEGDCGDATVAIVAKKTNDFYHLFFYGRYDLSELSDAQKTVLSTFKFIK